MLKIVDDENALFFKISKHILKITFCTFLHQVENIGIAVCFSTKMHFAALLNDIKLVPSKVAHCIFSGKDIPVYPYRPLYAGVQLFLEPNTSPLPFSLTHVLRVSEVPVPLTAQSTLGASGR